MLRRVLFFGHGRMWVRWLLASNPCSTAGGGLHCLSCFGTEGPCPRGTLLKGSIC